MTVLISDDDVRSHFTMGNCIAAVRDAYRAAGIDDLEVSTRRVVGGIAGCRLLALSAQSPTLGMMLATSYTGAPIEADRNLAQFSRREKIYVLFDVETGACEAVIGGKQLSWLQTGAMGAVAIDALSAPRASTVGLIGAGRQARSALLGALDVRAIDHVRVWSRTPSRARELAEEFRDRVVIEAVDEPRTAVEDADIVLTTTTAAEPVVEGAWLAPGAHVNSIGAHYPERRELDSVAVREASVFVDTRTQARAEKGELLLAEREGAFSWDDVVAELGEVVAGTAGWSRDEGARTFFASCGSGIEALGAAVGAYRQFVTTEVPTFSFAGSPRG